MTPGIDDLVRRGSVQRVPIDTRPVAIQIGPSTGESTRTKTNDALQMIASAIKRAS